MLLAFIRRLRSFEGYHDQLGADDVIPEEARNTSERACFGKVVLNGRHVIIAGPNRQARLRAGKDALDLLQQYRTDEDLAAYIDRGEETAHRHCLSSQSANANAWGSQCWPGAASASSSLGQPVPGQPVPEEEPLKQNLASRSASSKVAFPNSPSESSRMRRSGSRPRDQLQDHDAVKNHQRFKNPCPWMWLQKFCTDCSCIPDQLQTTTASQPMLT